MNWRRLFGERTVIMSYGVKRVIAYRLFFFAGIVVIIMNKYICWTRKKSIRTIMQVKYSGVGRTAIELQS